MILTRETRKKSKMEGEREIPREKKRRRREEDKYTRMGETAATDRRCDKEDKV